MNLKPSLDPYFLSDLDTFPIADVGSHVEAAAREGSLEALENLTSSLIDRALRALRSGSQQDLLEEAMAVSHGLSGEAGDALRERHPEIHGAWTALDDLLAEAGQRNDRAAVPGILKSTGKHGKKVLEILAREGKPVARAQLLTELGIGESHLSHLLHHLEDADLVLRFRSGKAVQVVLGRVGKEFTESSVFPKWVQHLCELLDKLRNQEPVGRQEAVDELQRLGVPSELAAERLARPIGLLSEMLAAQARTLLLQYHGSGRDLESFSQGRNPAARKAQEELQQTDSLFAASNGRRWDSVSA